MANSNGWGDGASNNDIGWGKGADNAIGWGSIYADSWAGATDIVGTPAVDPDAQAFITAASITDPTQQSAINQLVVDLKGYNIWTKLRACYPFIGGTSSTHKWNLKDPRDLDVAFRLRFFGGAVHTSNGVQGNALNAYYNTYLNANSLPISSNASGVYIRTDVSESGVDFGAINTNAYDSAQFGSRNTSNQYVSRWYQAGNTLNTTSNSDSRGFYQLTRRNSSEYITAKNTSKVVVAAPASSVIPSMPFYGLAAYFVPTAADAFHGSKQIAFHYFADSSLSNTELDNLYTAVQAFQVTLGRSIGTQTVSDADAQAFVTNAGIVDQVEANAVNNLVIGLKADGLWIKMKAVYPFVGGTSTSTTYNLRNTAQYQISWNGGWTWNSQGVTGNASNSFANTGFNPNSAFSTNDSAHLSLYSRTNSAASAYVDFGATNGAGSSTALNSAYTNSALSLLHNGSTGISTSNTNTQGFYVGSRTTSAIHKLFKGAVQIGSTDTTSAGTRPNLNLYLGAYNVNNIALYHTNRNYAFASIGDGLTDADVTNLNSRVTTFQTTLNRL